MALVACSECDGLVSAAAAACPHCGHPLTRTPTVPQGVQEARRAMVWFGLFVLAVPVVFMLGAYGTLSPCGAVASELSRRVVRLTADSGRDEVVAAMVPFFADHMAASMSTGECLRVLPYISAGRLDREIPAALGGQ